MIKSNFHPKKIRLPQRPALSYGYQGNGLRNTKGVTRESFHDIQALTFLTFTHF